MVTYLAKSLPTTLMMGIPYLHIIWIILALSSLLRRNNHNILMIFLPRLSPTILEIQQILLNKSAHSRLLVLITLLLIQPLMPKVKQLSLLLLCKLITVMAQLPHKLQPKGLVTLPRQLCSKLRYLSTMTTIPTLPFRIRPLSSEIMMKSKHIKLSAS